MIYIISLLASCNSFCFPPDGAKQQGQLEGLDVLKDTPNSANSKSDWLKNMSINNIVPLASTASGFSQDSEGLV